MTPHLREKQLPMILFIYHVYLPSIFPPTFESEQRLTDYVGMFLSLYLWMEDVIKTSIYQCIINWEFGEETGRESKVTDADGIDDCKILFHPYPIERLDEPLPVYGICLYEECPIKYMSHLHTCGCKMLSTMPKEIKGIEACGWIIEIWNLFIRIGIEFLMEYAFYLCSRAMCMHIEELIMILYYFSLIINFGMLVVRCVTLDSEFFAYNVICFFPLSEGVDVYIAYRSGVWLWPAEGKSIAFH